MGSEAGVIELAQIDSDNDNSVNDALNLFYFTLPPFIYLLAGFVLRGLDPALSITPLFITFISLCMFCWKYFAWHRKHRNIQFPDERFQMGLTLRRNSAIFASAAFLLLVLFIYTKLL